MTYLMPKELPLLSLKNKGGFSVNFLADGRFHSLRKNQFMFNLLETAGYEAPVQKVLLRLYQDNAIAQTFSLTEPSESVTAHYCAQCLRYTTLNDLFKAEVVVTLAEDDTLFYTIHVDNQSSSAIKFDIVYGQDVGVASVGCIKSNEAYTSQYIDHKVFNTADHGYITCSRQNMEQDGVNPFVQIGSLQRVNSYSTDAYQFFGNSYRVTRQIEMQHATELANQNYQYEFAYIALQSEIQTLAPAQRSEQVFYNHFCEHIAECNVAEPFAVAKITASYATTSQASTEKGAALPYHKDALMQSGLFVSADTDAHWLDTQYPVRHHEEIIDGQLLSFFTPEGGYVTLKEKELIQERPSGHIAITGGFYEGTDKLLSSTSFGMGIFNSQVTLGNTSFNKLMGINRNPLNLQKFTGQRIFIARDNEYVQLGVPTSYEAGYNYAKWFYYQGDEQIEVCTFTSADSPVLALEIRSAKPHRFVISNALQFSNNEHESCVNIEHHGQRFHIKGDNELIASNYPELNYVIDVINPFEILSTAHNNLLLAIEGQVIRLTITGSLTESCRQWSVPQIEFAQEQTQYRALMAKLVNGLSIDTTVAGIGKIGEMVNWYAHNAMIHFLSPHGLEQYSGAAWGTRDVSQGPMEFFLCTQNYSMAAKIIKTLYSHQYLESGRWPQWFMFDNYYRIQQDHSHGDVIVWPFKVVASYIAASGDHAILEQEIPYTSTKSSFGFTDKSYPLIDHLRKQLEYVQNNLIEGTHLLAYGDGDWDDTLQPKDAELRKRMVSSWTIELLLQSFAGLISVLEKYQRYPEFVAEIKELRTKMVVDFERYAVIDGVVGGFLLKEGNSFVPMLHPNDKVTKIKYRLLPMTRGIISEIFSPETAASHYKLIEDHLLFPDGVRLMAEPITYNAGKQSYFKRAEQATNVGREIGLQYCHAHVRFIEALCKLGKGKEALENVMRLIPINLQETVPNAAVRQSNTFFSSSDGNFLDRYDFKQNFNKLKTGEIKVKGGWRVYSSGPGIMLNQIVTNLFGLRDDAESIVIDPVLPVSQENYQFNYSLMGQSVTLKIHAQNAEHSPKRILLNGSELPISGFTENRYRQGGAVLNKAVFQNNMRSGENILDIYM